MKKIIRLLAASFFFVLVSFLDISCKNDGPTFIVDASKDSLRLFSRLSPVYNISPNTSANVMDRLVWNEPKLGVAANITYEVQLATSADALFEAIASTSETNFAILINAILPWVKKLGLDTMQSAEQGTLYLRIRAYVGSNGAPSNTAQLFSPIYPLHIKFEPIKSDAEVCDSLFFIGDALPDVKWNFGKAIILKSCGKGAVKMAAVTLSSAAEFPTCNFFTKPNDWDSRKGYKAFLDEGYAIDANFEDDGKENEHNFKFIGTNGSYTLTIDEKNKKITLTKIP